MIEFVVGIPGSGKSYFAMDLLTAELLKGARPICTNLPINWGGLVAYLNDREGQLGSFNLFEWVRVFFLRLIGRRAKFRGRAPGRDWAVELPKRLRIIPDDDLPFFYTFRGDGKGGWWEHERNECSADKFRFDQREGDSGVTYYLDECHIHLPAESRKATDHRAGYCTQHRKLGDDCIMLTQNAGQVLKLWRDNAQSFIELENGGQTKLFRFFAQPPVVNWKKFNKASGQRWSSESGQFGISPRGLGTTYYTNKGIGVIGRTADTKRKARGLPFWLVPVFGVLLLYVAIRLPIWIGFGMVKSAMIGGQLAVNSNKSPLATNSPGVPLMLPPVPQSVAIPLPPVPSGSFPVQTAPPSRLDAPPLQDEPPPFHLTGWQLQGDRLRYFWSDGEETAVKLADLTPWDLAFLEPGDQRRVRQVLERKGIDASKTKTVPSEETKTVPSEETKSVPSAFELLK